MAMKGVVGAGRPHLHVSSRADLTGEMYEKIFNVALCFSSVYVCGSGEFCSEEEDQTADLQ